MRYRLVGYTVLLLSLAVASYGLTTLLLEKTPASVAPLPEPVVAAGPEVPQEVIDRVLNEARRAVAEDKAKPRFAGTLGDFVVRQASDRLPASDPCPMASTRDQDFIPSELNLPGTYQQGSCANGTVISSFGQLGGRRSFVGKPEVVADAPQDRLSVLDIDGHPALAVAPVPDFAPWLIYVIQRPASSSTPGIVIQLLVTEGGLQQGIEVARAVMRQ